MSFVETPSGNTAIAPEAKDLTHGSASTREITIAHSPDSDDAFMFYALATNKVRVPGLRFTHTLCDIETLNQKARQGEGVYDVTAISFHAYPYIQDNYALLPSGGSVGDGYGPMIVATQGFSQSEVKHKKIAVPGTLTTAYLALRLFAPGIETEVVPFDQIIPADRRRQVRSRTDHPRRPADVCEGRPATHRGPGQVVVENHRTSFALGRKRDPAQPGTGVDRQRFRALRDSIQYALDHREEALGLRHAIRARPRSATGR